MSAWGLGLTYFPHGNNFTYHRQKELPVLNNKRKIRFNLHLGYAYTDDQGSPGGPKYPAYTFFPYLSMRTGKTGLKGQVILGVESTYYTSIHTFILDNEPFYESPFFNSIKIAPNIGYEFFYGRLSILGQSGIYIYNPFRERGLIPTKLGIQYYLFKPANTQIRHQLRAGIYLKSHLAVADYVEFGLAYTF